jgi:Uma2 family endonuclease
MVEVLSPSTFNHDMGFKSTIYRAISSLEQMLFIDSTTVQVFVFTKVKDSEDWLLKTLSEPTATVDVLGEGKLCLADIYQQVDFPKKA